MLSTLKFSFHYFCNIKNNFILFSILKMLILKRFLFIFKNTFFIIFSFKLSLHFIFKKSLNFLINIIIIIFVFYLFINIIIYFFLIDIFIIIIIVFSMRYNVYNNFNFLIISINFLYLKY